MLGGEGTHYFVLIKKIKETIMISRIFLNFALFSHKNTCVFMKAHTSYFDNSKFYLIYFRCSTAQHIRRKPGRQLVTFLLVTNMAMWTVNRLENTRADFHPVELRFYGVWAWTIITHVSMPLAIFYRFHSTVCLCEIWKSTYKMRLVS